MSYLKKIDIKRGIRDRLNAVKLAREAGISMNDALKAVRAARKEGISLEKLMEKGRYRAPIRGISFKNYYYFRGWNFTDQELDELAEYIRLYNKRQKSVREWYVECAHERSGIDKDKLSKRLDVVLSKGYDINNFIREGYYKRTTKRLRELPEKCKVPDRVQLPHLKGQEDIVRKKTGWSHAKYMLEFLKSNALIGATGWEFELFRLYETPLEEQEKLVTTRMKEMIVTRNTDWEHKSYKIFRYKPTFYEVFKDFVHRDWFMPEGISEDDFLKRISGWGDYLIYKPNHAQKGKGVRKFRINESEDQNREVYRTVMEDPECTIEECIIQHDVMAAFYPGSINSIRVVTMRHGDDVDFFYGMFRTGRNGCVDNWSQGGVCAAVDPETGIICTDGVIFDGSTVEAHPVTGTKFKGTQIPHWDKVREACIRAAKVVPNNPLVGWDITVTPEGEVEFIEGNHSPGIVGIQVAYFICLDQGLAYKYHPYIDFD